jgi:hypothetical protein
MKKYESEAIILNQAMTLTYTGFVLGSGRAVVVVQFLN